jgi:hypothetical protein
MINVAGRYYVDRHKECHIQKKVFWSWFQTSQYPERSEVINNDAGDL